MAASSTTERNVKTNFKGDASDGIRASREMERELKRFQREQARTQKEIARQQAEFSAQSERGADRLISAFGSVTKGILSIGSAVSSAQGLAGAASAVATLSGVAVALPGILAAGAAAGGVFKLALSGVGDAISAKDLKEFNEVTKDMAPNAVELARAVRDQNERFTELKKTVQNNFFEGFGDDVRTLADRYFPILKSRSADIATEWNRMGREAAKALLAPGAVEDVNSVLKDTRDGLKELRPALGNVITGVLDLSAVGSTRLGSVSKAVTGVTEDFKKWVAEGIKTGRINDLLEDGVSMAKQLGRVMSNVKDIGGALFHGLTNEGKSFVDGLIKSTQAVKDFVTSADGQRTIKALASALGTASDVARNVFSAALTQVGGIIDKLGPGFEGFARGVGTFLVNAINTVGPLLQGLAAFLSDHAAIVERLTPAIIGLVLAYKGMRVAEEVKTWVKGLDVLLNGVQTSAAGAAGAIGDEKAKGGLVGRLGGLKAIAGVIGLAVVADQLDDINVKAAGSADKLSGVDAQLHNIKGAAEQLLSLDFSGIAKEIGDELKQIDEQFRNGKSPIGKLITGEKGKVGFEISAGVDTSTAQEDLKHLTDEIGRTSASVKINGNSLPAGLALKKVITEIDNGAGTVDVNGNTIDANRALDDLVRQINESTGTIKVDGNEVPAGQVLVGLLNRVNGSRGMIGVDADTSSAQGVINRFITMNDGKQISIFVNAKGDAGGLASAGRLAGGGRPFDGRVRGPGTPTSDTAGLFMLSNDEHVLAGADVQALGGHSAVYRLRALARQGKFRGFADGGTPASLTTKVPAPSSTPSIHVGGATTSVAVFIDGQEFRGIVRSEINSSQRAADRRKRAGSGAL